MNIRTWIISMIAFLLAAVVFSLYFLFYNQFSVALEDKVVSQLTSVKTLKRLEIEKYLRSQWDEFQLNENNIGNYELTQNTELKSKLKMPGVYDVTPYFKNGTMLLAFVKFDDRFNIIVDTIGGQYIQQILLQRAGLGNSGETYIVGEDFRLRSVSRFFPDTPPFDIDAKSEPVTNSFNKEFTDKVYKDYRGVRVYSAYFLLEFSNIRWAVISEIDEKEVMEPLKDIESNLLKMAFLILIVALLLGLYFTQYISKPLESMQLKIAQMINGNYQIEINSETYFKEINNVLDVLELLKISLSKSIDFSKEVGAMNFEAAFEPTSGKDVLGVSLLKMREKLIEYNEKINQSNLAKKKGLIEGQELERKRLAKELHDGIGVLLTSLRMYVESIAIGEKEKLKIKELIDRTIEDVRGMTFALMPPTLIDFGVGQALTTFVELIKNTTDITLQFNNEIYKSDSKIDLNIGIAIFRICQELINNSVKHSKAKKNVLSVTEFSDFLTIYFFDDGIGYDMDKVKKGSGINNIIERLEVINGTIVFNTQKNNSIIEIEIPLK